MLTMPDSATFFAVVNAILGLLVGGYYLYRAQAPSPKRGLYITVGAVSIAVGVIYGLFLGGIIAPLDVGPVFLRPAFSLFLVIVLALGVADKG